MSETLTVGKKKVRAIKTQDSKGRRGYFIGEPEWDEIKNLARKSRRIPELVYMFSPRGKLKIMSVKEAQGEKLLADFKEAFAESMEILSGKRKGRDAEEWIKSL